jgi:hypothetical protein
MTKKTPTQNLSDPMLIGKFDQKISKLFEEKRRFLPNPQLKKPMIQISPNELNNMRNDINVLRNLLQIEINHKNSLLIQIQKNQNEINANIAYLKKVISLLDSDKIDQIKELKNNLQVLINIQQSNQNSTAIYLKQIDILYQKERNLASESKKISYIVKKDDKIKTEKFVNSNNKQNKKNKQNTQIYIICLLVIAIIFYYTNYKK